MIINYDFTDAVEYCSDVIIYSKYRDINKVNKALQNLKKEFNKFFKGSNCDDIIYTESDSMFFGMCVYPIVSKEIVNAILQDEKSIRFNHYTIEIDSKLFKPELNITSRELLAMFLHEIGHIVNDPTPVEELRDSISIGLAKKGDSIDVPRSVQYSQILAFGFKNTIRKLTSMFCVYKNGEVLADEFVYMCGYGEALNSIFNKLCKNGMIINDDVNKLTALTWSLNLYKNVKMERIPALRLLRRMRNLTGSKTERREMEILEKALNNIDDNSLQEYCDLSNIMNYYVFNENKKENIQTKYAKMRREITLKNINKFEQDMYEYTMKIRHVSTEEDAMYLMRQLNTRISVIEDFIDKTRLSQYELKKYWSLLDKYYSLRDQLAKITTYRYDYSGSVIQVKYPDIVKDRY